MKMIKRIWLPVIIALTVSLIQAGAQLSSPYTIFGAGQIEDNGFGVNEAMGGTGIGLSSSRSLNNINPASYSGIDTLSFLFEVGVSGTYSQFKTTGTTQQQFDGNLRYIALGFRITKWWSTSLGVAPYSSVGYRIRSAAHIDGDLTEYTRTFTGEGGINQFYSGNSFRFFKNLSLGINLSYLFGTIAQDEIFSSGGQFGGYQIEKNNYIHNLYVDYGLQFSLFPNDWKCTLGLIYGNKKNLVNSTDTYLTYSSNKIKLDDDQSGDFFIPAKYGIGLGIEKKQKLRLGVDYERRDWSEASFTNPLLSLRNSERISAGVEYTPYSNYRERGFRRLYYRLGGSMENSYLIIEGVPVNSISLSAGVGIPLKNDFSMINLTLEAGKNGTTNKGLIQENYLMLHVNLSLRDIWFMKPKYD